MQTLSRDNPDDTFEFVAAVDATTAGFIVVMVSDHDNTFTWFVACYGLPMHHTPIAFHAWFAVLFSQSFDSVLLDVML